MNESSNTGPSITESGVTHGSPRTILRLEGLATLTIASLLYARLDLGWIWYAVLFLLPGHLDAGLSCGP